MSKTFTYLTIFYCILLHNCLIGCHKSHEFKPLSEVSNGEHDKQTTEDHSNLSRVSCVLMKSLAYGFQRAVNEYSLINHETNFGRAIKDVDVARYLNEICPDASGNPREYHENGHKVKRNHHSVNVRNKPANITTNSTRANDTKPANTDEHRDNQVNEFERLLKSVQDVTNALKLQLSASGRRHFKHANEANATSVRNKTDSHVIQTPAGSVPDANVTFVDETPPKNSTRPQIAESKRRHQHNHKKHKRLDTKSRPQEENAVEQDDIADDLYVAERFREEEKLEKARDVRKQVRNDATAPKVDAKHIAKRSVDKNTKTRNGFNKKSKVTDRNNKKVLKKQKKYQGKSTNLHKKQKSKKNTWKQ